MIYNNDDNFYPTNEPTEFQKYPIFLTKSPQIVVPIFNETRTINYTCICKSNQNRNDYDNKFIILIVATTISSFSCVLFFFIIIWYRFFFKRKLLNKHKNIVSIFEDFGIKINNENAF
jgi:hypothetical protein